MLDLNAALKRYDELVQKGRDALQYEITEKNERWFDTGEFVADLEHFLNEALAPNKTYLYGEDMATGKKIQIERIKNV